MRTLSYKVTHFDNISAAQVPPRLVASTTADLTRILETEEDKGDSTLRQEEAVAWLLTVASWVHHVGPSAGSLPSTRYQTSLNLQSANLALEYILSLATNLVCISEPLGAASAPRFSFKLEEQELQPAWRALKRLAPRNLLAMNIALNIGAGTSASNMNVSRG